MQRKIRILTITYTTWREDNNLGNSYSNIFKGMDDRLEFASIYFKDTMPENALCHNYFHISEKKLFKSIFRESQLVKDFFWRIRWIPQNRNSRQHITKPEACGGKSSC